MFVLYPTSSRVIFRVTLKLTFGPPIYLQQPDWWAPSGANHLVGIDLTSRMLALDCALNGKILRHHRRTISMTNTRPPSFEPPERGIPSSRLPRKPQTANRKPQTDKQSHWQDGHNRINGLLVVFLFSLSSLLLTYNLLLLLLSSLARMESILPHSLAGMGTVVVLVLVKQPRFYTFQDQSRVRFLSLEEAVVSSSLRVAPDYHCSVCDQS